MSKRMTTINIAGVDKAKILAALYNASHPQGMGFLHYTPDEMTQVEAEKIIAEARERQSTMTGGDTPSIYFDYLKGRVLKIQLGGDTLRTDLYDRDNGPNAAFLVLTRAGIVPPTAADEIVTV